MGKKKQGMQVLYGSMKKHWLMYIQQVNMNVNPTCDQSMRKLNLMISLLGTLDSKFMQPGFKFEYKFLDEGYYKPSVMQLDWVNGYKRNYYTSHMGWKSIVDEVKEINEHVEFERNMQGQDDELDDDA